MFSESAELYDAIYAFKDYAAEAARVAAIVRAAHPSARTLLDVGCGTGEHARLLTAEQGFQADGLDLDAALLDVARRKCPTGQFYQADMADFRLNQQYDAVVCLFSAIAYLTTLERVTRGLRCLRDHLTPAGVVIVEPWLPPQAFMHGRTFVHTGEARGVHVERRSWTEIVGRVSRLHFEYRITQHGRTKQARETHALGLFTEDEMRQAFEDVGLDARFDPVGLTDRGLWTARRAAVG